MRTTWSLIILAILFSYACNKKVEENIQTPKKVEGVSAVPTVGGVLVKWNLPDSATYMYLEVSYMKNGKKIIQNVANTESSVEILGLLNKYEYTFEVKPFNRGINTIVEGPVSITPTPVKPIRRAVNTVTEYTKVPVTADMINAYTQETTEGPKSNLVDGNINSFWHSAWSANVQPLPHWIQLNFTSTKSIGAIKYYLRQNANSSGYPNQFGFETSTNGTTWTRVWTSSPGLSIADPATEKELTLDKNYDSQYFRILILQTPGNTTFTHLGEISFYSTKAIVTDLEKDAEDNY